MAEKNKGVSIVFEILKRNGFYQGIKPVYKKLIY